MPIENQEAWNESYDKICKKYGFISVWINRRILERLRIGERVGADEKIVDIGCGNGNILALLKESGFRNLYGFDNREYPAPSPDIQMQVGDMTARFPYPDQFADCMLSYNVMHHCVNHAQYELFLSEVRRVLKPRGKFFLVEPERNFFRRTTQLVCSLPVIRSLGYAKYKYVVFQEEKREHALFFELEIVQFLKVRGFKILDQKSYMESILIYSIPT
ncbi:MAG: methyltransferase domain-containing protein [Candidatus Omnitrophica bacterium]|nr:methyltransferase domain-containing protein [Candidatus Omnitrophota bacterium]